MSFFHDVLRSSLDDFKRVCTEGRSLEERQLHLNRIDAVLANIIARTNEIVDGVRVDTFSPTTTQEIKRPTPQGIVQRGVYNTLRINNS